MFLFSDKIQTRMEHGDVFIRKLARFGVVCQVNGWYQAIDITAVKIQTNGGRIEQAFPETNLKVTTGAWDAYPLCSSLNNPEERLEDDEINENA